MSMDFEEWRDVVGAEESFEVSNTGLLRNKKTGHVTAGTEQKTTGMVTWTIRGKTKTIQSMVADAFVPGNGKRIEHIDGDKKNNRADNLRRVLTIRQMNEMDHRRNDMCCFDCAYGEYGRKKGEIAGCDERQPYGFCSCFRSRYGRD